MRPKPMLTLAAYTHTQLPRAVWLCPVLNGRVCPSLRVRGRTRIYNTTHVQHSYFVESKRALRNLAAEERELFQRVEREMKCILLFWGEKNSQCKYSINHKPQQLDQTLGIRKP